MGNVSVTNATLSITTIVLVCLICRMGFSTCTPRSGQCQVLFIDDLRTYKDSNRPVGGNNVDRGIIHRYLCPLRAPRTIATFASKSLPIGMRKRRFCSGCTVGFASSNF